ncbi:MAG: CAP domain-containing protein [bacterium]|nr:CAP domain-containing protein [bacterium]
MKISPPYILLLAGLAFFNFSFSPLTPSRTIDAKTIILATNQARALTGLSELAESKELDTAALEKAQDMQIQRYFAHQSPEGTSPWYWIEKNDYTFAIAGENLAINYNNVQELMTAWLESPSHRENILNPKFLDLGVGVRQFSIGSKNYTVIVQMFGAPPRMALR